MPNGQLSSQPIVSFAVAVVLFAIGRVIIRRTAEAEGDPWLAKALTVCLLLHLISAPLEIWVVDHLYDGIADYNRYDSQGVLLAPGFRHLDFSLAPGHLGGIVADGSVSIVAGVVFAIVGTDQAAAFLVFSWLSFIGIVFFYRAFTLTFSKAGGHRYGYLLFFLPALIFWTSDVSKEALMTFLLGLTAYGCARILAHRRGGYWLVLAASVGGIFIRPNMQMLALGGFTIAMIFRPMSSSVQLEGGRRTAGLVFLGALVGVAFFVTFHFLPGTQSSSLSLSTVNYNNSAAGNGGSYGFGSSVSYSANPIFFPRDVFVVLFDPLPINAHGGGEWLDAVENTLLVGAVFASLRHLRILPRAALARPYVIMCAIYTAAFAYSFAALGNLGLITREATVVLPFFLVLLCVPRGPRHRPPRYVWELPRHVRIARRRAQARRARAGASGRSIHT
jgi:hypothetical protein